MKHKKKHIRDESIQNIHNNAKTLYESFSSELAKGMLPNDLSFIDINYWEDQIRCKRFSLNDRINLFKALPHILHTSSINWIEPFESILDLYNPLSLSHQKFSNSNLDQPFHLVIMPFIQFAQKLAYNISPSIHNYLTKAALNSCIDHLAKILSNIGGQTLFSDFSAQSRKTHRKYCTSFYHGYSMRFFEKYSSLARLLTMETMLWVDSINLFIQHLDLDKGQLEKRFFRGKKIKKIQTLQQDDGPAHSVLGPNRIITFSNNRQLIYKTKSAQNDLFYNRLIQWVNKVDKNIQFDTYTVYDRKGYSWHEFIPNKDCKNKKEVEAYYVRLGYLSALLQILGSTDYHYGNIISKAGQPMLIDHETILNLNSPKRIFDIKEAHILKSKISNYNLLGAFNFEVSYSTKATKLTKTKKIKQISQTLYWRGKNIPLVSGRRVNPYNFKIQIASGYALGLKLLLKRQKSFISFIKNQLTSSALSHRYLHRPSIEYLLLLLNSYKPCYLKSGISRSIYFESLFQILGNKTPDSFTLCIISQELVCVEQNFWPRFILNNAETVALRKQQKNKKKTKSSYVKRQIIKNFQYLSKADNLEKEINNLSKHLKHLSKI